MTSTALAHDASSGPDRPATAPHFRVLFAICFCHLINDMLQSLLGAIYPDLKASYHLTFSQIGFVTLAYQATASLLQPMVGLATDRRPMPLSLPFGTLFTFAGLITLSAARDYATLLAGACVLGIGSSVFHPESSRVARTASGGRYGFAQSLFQVGGSVGGALGPAGAAVVVERWGQSSLGAFSATALVSTAVLARVGAWSKRNPPAARPRAQRVPTSEGPRAGLSRRRVAGSLLVQLVLVFSKYVYLASITSYYTFYLMHRFGLSVRAAQLHLFVFGAAVAVGTLAGGLLGDRFGRKRVLWFSILGVLPFTIALTYTNLLWTTVLSVGVGCVLASAFPIIIVYGQELIPGRVGLVAGLFFGFSFGAAGLGAAALGHLADATSVEHVPPLRVPAGARRAHRVSAAVRRTERCDSDVIAPDTRLMRHDSDVIAPDTRLMRHDSDVVALDTGLMRHDSDVVALDTGFDASRQRHHRARRRRREPRGRRRERRRRCRER